MKTKNYLYITAVVVAGFLSACSDDILDKKPLDGYTDVDVFADESLLRDFVNGTYRGVFYPFNGDEGFSDALTDNSFTQHGSAVTTVLPYTSGNLNKDNGESVTRGLWAGAYSVIRKTNLFFEQTEGSTTVPADRLTELTGEMRFIRAYEYFDLLRWYGGVPLITRTYSIAEGNYDVARNTPEEIAAFIASQCDSAIAELPSKSDDGYQKGRASVEAAMALKARTLLYIASPLFNKGGDVSRWAAARDANLAVMNLGNVSLVSGGDAYKAMFQGKNEQEVIYARYFSPSNTQSGNGINTMLMSSSYNGWATITPTQNMVDSYELTNGLLPSDGASGYDPQNPYVNRDPRFYASIVYQGADFQGTPFDYTNPGGKDSEDLTIPKNHNASRTGYTYRKWVLEDKAYDDGNIGPWITFRLAEFYLNYAECMIALKDDGAARTAINAVRSRMGMPDVSESGDQLIARYRNERRVELTLEDHYFFDMRRWMIGEQVVEQPIRIVTVGAGGTYTYKVSTRSDVANFRKWDDKLYFLPIPASEVQRSHDALKQNPGYE